jgi:hypothetical protein
MILRASAFVICLGLAACSDVSTEDAALIDLALPDQCFFVYPERPDDCAMRAPCIYADAEVGVLPTTDGSFVLTAAAVEGVWGETPTRIAEPYFRHFATPADAAAGIDNILSDLDVPARPLSETCLGLRPHQSVRFGDVISLRRELLSRGVSHVELHSELVDDPRRRGELVLWSPEALDQLAPMLQRFATDNGLTFNSREDQTFWLEGPALYISISPRDGGDPETISKHFYVSLRLDIAPDGSLPTEAAMNHHAEDLARAIGTIDGAQVRLGGW